MNACPTSAAQTMIDSSLLYRPAAGALARQREDPAADALRHAEVLRDARAFVAVDERMPDERGPDDDRFVLAVPARCWCARAAARGSSGRRSPPRRGTAGCACIRSRR